MTKLELLKQLESLNAEVNELHLQIKKREIAIDNLNRRIESLKLRLEEGEYERT